MLHVISSDQVCIHDTDTFIFEIRFGLLMQISIQWIQNMYKITKLHTLQQDYSDQDCPGPLSDIGTDRWLTIWDWTTRLPPTPNVSYTCTSTYM